MGSMVNLNVRGSIVKGEPEVKGIVDGQLVTIKKAEELERLTVDFTLSAKQEDIFDIFYHAARGWKAGTLINR